MALTPSPAQVEANARARAQGNQQARVLSSPLLKRSELLSQMLAEGREPQRIAGYGDLGIRLLSQALLQSAQGKTDEAVRAQQSNADLERRQRLAAAVGGSVEGTPQEVGNGRLGNPLAGLSGLFNRGATPPIEQQAPEAANPVPTAASQVMSSGPIMGQEMPPAAPSPVPSAMAAQPAAPQAQNATPQAAPVPQQAANPLGPSEGERALILQYLNSGDPGQVAQAEQLIQTIQMRAAAPSATRQEYQAVNGVPGVFDPATNQWTPTPGGVPEVARNQNAVVGDGNPYGVAEGTGITLDPFNRPQIVGRPPEGFARGSGGLRPESGGPQDQTTGGNQISNERQLRGEYRAATQEYRDARLGLNKVEAAANDRSGASDVALIFGYMKTLDPQSTVREGEFATAQNTGSIPERVLSAYNRALQGDRLTDTQRGEFVRSARSQFQTYEQGYQDRQQEYRGIAERYRLDPRNILGEDGGGSPSPAPRQQQRQPSRAQPSGGQPRRRTYNPATGMLE